jgi:hypothetical protein
MNKYPTAEKPNALKTYPAKIGPKNCPIFNPLSF